MLMLFSVPAPGLAQWLLLSALLFAIGLYGLLTRRNAVGVLIALELMLNSCALNFVAFDRFGVYRLADGQVMAIFVIATAAAEVVVAMAIFVALFKYRKTADVTSMDLLRK